MSDDLVHLRGSLSNVRGGLSDTMFLPYSGGGGGGGGLMTLCT